MKTPTAAVLVTLATMCLPSTAFADGERAQGDGFCRELGVDVWGLSYHLNHRDFDYNDRNYGTGLRCYERPDWSLLGRSKDTQLFFQVDALVDSHRGFLFPISLGVEHRVGHLSETCKVFAEGALTFAYYGNPTVNAAQFTWGPVPGLAFGCGRAKINVMFVPSPSREVLAAIAASVTIGVKRSRNQLPETSR